MLLLTSRPDTSVQTKNTVRVPMPSALYVQFKPPGANCNNTGVLFSCSFLFITPMHHHSIHHSNASTDLFIGRLPLITLDFLWTTYCVVWLLLLFLDFLAYVQLIYERIKTIVFLLTHQPSSLIKYLKVLLVGSLCVAVAVARKCGSSTTSNVFCRKIDDSGSGDGKPLQLRKSENRSFWTNEEITNVGLKVGCVLRYGYGPGCQSFLTILCKLIEGDGKQIFRCKTGYKQQVNFHYYTNSTVVSRFSRNLHCSSDFDPPPNFLFFNSYFILFMLLN